MTTLTIVTPEPPWGHHFGEVVRVADDHGNEMRGDVTRVSDHELLVRVGGKPLAFQELDGEGQGWMWRG